MIRTGELALVTLLLAATGNPQNAPGVVSRTPAHEDVEVDPTMTELIVVFDRPMSDTGFSFCGGGPSFPKIRDGERIHWRDARTCVMPVELRPDHTYVMSLNCPAAQNFRSRDGVALQPTPWTFTTLPAVLPDREEQTKLNEKAFDELRDVLARSYSYHDLRDLDWDRIYANARADVTGSLTTAGWAMRAGRMLAPAQDVHLYLRYRGNTVPTGRRAVDSLFRRHLLERYVEGLQEVGRNALAGRTEDGIGYLVIGSWSGADNVDAIERELGQMKDCKALVIDVRPNSGGDETLARRVAEWFVDGTKVYAKNRYRTAAGERGFGPVLDRSLTGNEDLERRFDKPVAVLSSRYVMSSCEAFLLMMKQARQCRVVGQRSYGSSANPKPHELCNGVQVVVPSWQAMTPDGECFESVGIAPDVEVKGDSDDFQAEDPILERALQLLRKRGR